MNKESLEIAADYLDDGQFHEEASFLREMVYEELDDTRLLDAVQSGVDDNLVCFTPENNNNDITKRLIYVMKSVMKDDLHTLLVPTDAYPLDFDPWNDKPWGVTVIRDPRFNEDGMVRRYYSEDNTYSLPSYKTNLLLGIGSKLKYHNKYILGAC